MMPKTKPLSDMIRAKRKIPTTRIRPSSTGPPAHETCALGAELDGLGVKMQPNHFEQRRTGAGIAVNLCGPVWRLISAATIYIFLFGLAAISHHGVQFN